MLWVFLIASFLAAALLFAVQPFAARQVLPAFGGSPAVWNTAVMFFQAGLLAGYCYAHVLTTRLGRRSQVAVHGAVLLGAALVPIGIDAGSAAEASGHANALHLVGLLALSVGLPYFAVSTAGPLLQRWFAWTGHGSAGDPYFMYAASNAGSFAGLLAYPFVIERVWTLPEQAMWWRWGFVAFAGLCLLAGVLAARVGRDAAAEGPGREPPIEPAAWRRRGLWVFLAFVPSSLMLGVTQYLSVDLAATPLLWVVPLGLYLLTYVAAFSRIGDDLTRVSARLWPIVASAVVLAFLLQARQPILVIAALHLAVLVGAGCLCHGRLRASRPGVGRLTEFYLCVAIGGAMGGVFNSLAAPVVFDDLHEYPLAIVLACAALPVGGPGVGGRGWLRALWLLPPAMLAWVWFGPEAHLVQAEDGREVSLLLVAGVPVLVMYLLSRSRGLFLGAAAALLLGVALRTDGTRVEMRERSFFGVHTVRIDAAGRFRQLGHGTTVHGLCWLDPDRRNEPLTYYHRAGPAGQVFGEIGDRFESAAFVGLGAGSLAAYARPGQRFDFYEIDPTVVRIATDPAYFTFLADSAAGLEIAVGDGRLLLARAEGASYDLIVLDAFSSDAVPMHLLTLEAFEIYLSRLAPDGVLLVHVSNRHLDLGAFVAAALRDLGVPALERRDVRTLDQAVERGLYTSHWLLASRDGAVFGSLGSDVQWSAPQPAARAWTDARADIVSALLSE